MPRDYDSAPASEALGLGNIVRGLAGDLSDLREGRISPNDALARAAVAKQIFNGVRLYLAASRFIDAPSPRAALPEASDDH